MSSSTTTNEAPAMLSEMLELLESIDGSESDLSVGESSVAESDTNSSLVQPVRGKGETPKASAPVVRRGRPSKAQQKLSATNKEGKLRSPVPYSTDLQRRKRAELRVLRQEAQELNAQLALLQNTRHYRIGAETTHQPEQSDLSGWRSLAMIEYEERQRAERTNRKLKAIMANQLEVHASIRKLLGRSIVCEGMEFVFQPQPTADRPLSQIDFSDAILADLATDVERLRLQTDSVFRPLESSATISCSTKSWCHERLGDLVETSSVTPLACDIREASELLWHHVTTKKNKDAEKAFRFVRTRNPSTIERNCIASLRDGKDALLCLDGVNILRKFDDTDRIVLVGTTTWFLPTGGLRFEDHHWTVISPSPTDPLHASVVQSCYYLRVTKLDAASVQPADVDHVQKMVLGSISKKLRGVLQRQQNALLCKVDPVATRAMQVNV